MKKIKFFIVPVVLFAIGFGAFKVINSNHQNLTTVEIDWRLLGELDYVSGAAPEELKILNSKKVKMPGFMVPLEDEQKKVTEFLLVPTPQACIHVPAPPPNQMVYVKMKKGTEVAYGPIWIHGDFSIMTKQSMYGDASFEIEGDFIEPYK